MCHVMFGLELRRSEAYQELTAAIRLTGIKTQDRIRDVDPYLTFNNGYSQREDAMCLVDNRSGN